MVISILASGYNRGDIVKTEIDLSSPITVETPIKTNKFGNFLRVFFARKIVIIGIVILLVFVLTAIFAPIIAPYDPYETNVAKRLQPPSAEHWLGTDLVGRDLLSRIIYGSQTSILVGLASVGLAGIVGMLLGLLAGYIGGIIDTLIMRFIDALMAIPPIMLALALGVVMGGGLKNVIIALGVSLIPSYTRLMRGQVLQVKQNDYVLAGEIMGASTLRNMFVHVVPNCISPLIVLATLNLGIAILAEAGLSFLGLGVTPPGAAWGSMVNEGYKYLYSNPILSFAPGLCIVIVVLAFNIVGDALRDALDPRLRGTQ